MNRQQARALKKQASSPAEQKMAEQVAKFGKLPQQCSACTKAFDKKDRSMIESWSVVVKQEIVRLFCPECINKTKEVIDGSHANIK
jgi:Zn finger protein HypA/HybF involved in hydrogenase expression